MAHRDEWPRHELAFSLVMITLRVLAIVFPLLLLTIAASVAGGSGDDPGTADLVGIMLI
jgi:hypothetical protein